ncbi:MAG: sigma-70 family RNA polymerase sigma factor [Tepidisphaeraceae bacterium]|jgi:RNA polymerase sigma-70 factor (ECF subfamily)
MAEHGNADDFIQLFTAHQSSLRAYVLSMVPRWSDAEEIVQQCSLILWKKFSQFRPGTNFFAWACQVARLEVKDFRKRQRREQIVFSDEFIDAVADEVFEMQAELPARLRALQGCVEKLSRDQRELLRLRYNEGGSVNSVSQAVNRSVDSVYKSLSRIRQALHECINRALVIGDF